jgi:hypothetical protein
MQIKKSKSLITLEPLTEEEKNSIANETEMNIEDSCLLIATKLKEKKVDLVRRLVKFSGR